MKNIFLAFYNGLSKLNDTRIIPCFYESFIDGLRKAGNQVMYCPHGFFGADFPDSVPFDILTTLRKFNPDLIILFNNSFYELSKYFDCPIVIYEVDSLLYYSNKERLSSYPERYKYIVSQSGSIKLLEDKFNVRPQDICYIPLFTSIISENIPKTKDISFIGSKFGGFYLSTVFNKFMQTSPSKKEIAEFKKVKDIIIENPFVSVEEIINIIKPTSKTVINMIDIPNFIWIMSNTNRIQTLSQIADLGLVLYGTNNWITDLIYEPDLVLCYNNQKVFSVKHNQDIYNASKICININHLQATSGFSWRVCDIMASNACLVTEFRPDLEKLFPGTDIPVFNNRYEAREKCIKLLNNENMRNDIVLKCQEIIRQRYRFEVFLEKFENFLSLKLNNTLDYQ